MPPGYRSDLAYVHHVGFTAFARRSAPAILRLLGSARAGSLVVDLGCGSGVLAHRLGRAGWQVLGIDRSSAMLTIARRTAPRATFRRGSFVDVALPRCHAVTALGEVLGYRFDVRSGPAALTRLVRRVHAALEPRGLFIFDLAGPGRLPDAAPQRSWRAGRDWAVLVEMREDRARAMLVREVVTFRAAGPTWRRTRERHVLHLHERATVCALLRHAGFRVRTVHAWGAERLLPGVVGYVARKA